jgi:1,4-alpha-glucan branching enzyme
MWTYAGKKLLFMGNECGQREEWNHDASLSWESLDGPMHAGLKRYVRDLNLVYQSEPALYEQDFAWDGFQWIDANDAENSVLTYIRRAENPEDFLVILCNFTPVVREGYTIGVPTGGSYRELINSDKEIYWGSGVSLGELPIDARKQPSHNLPFSLRLTLPPLATMILKPCTSQ